MKINLTPFLLVLLLAGCDTGNSAVLEPTEKNVGVWPQLQSPVPLYPMIEARIDELLSRMSIEQKVGQMIQAEIRWVQPEDVRDYHLGSVLNGGGGYPGGNKYSSIVDWVSLADEFYAASMDSSDGRLAIPVLWGTDSVHGASNVYGATLFPHNIGLGAMRNPGLMRRIGEVTALETAVIGIPWTFAPTVAVARDDRWGRTYESYSEDPEIVRTYTEAVISGLQGSLGSEERLDETRVLATAKHFLGDGGTYDGTDQGDTSITEHELYSIHGQGYISALQAGVRSIMVSYSSWQGLKMHGNRYLLTEILKNRMGFNGFIVGDWDGHSQVPGCSKRSCAAAINAGIDLIMVPRHWKSFYTNTVSQVERGDIPIERVDDAVRRILRVKLEAGLFEAGAPSTRRFAGRAEHLGSAANRDVARQAVRESMVLLKNTGSLLPLKPDMDVLVAGPSANDVSRQSGGWSLTWQGTDNDNDDFPGATTIFDGIRDRVTMAGGKATLSVDGKYEARPDVAIVVWGEPPYAECYGDRTHLHFGASYPEALTILEGLQKQGIPVVSVMVSGRPLWVNAHLNASDAFVAAWLPGTEGAGVSEVLFRNPSGEIDHDFQGRLSFSWPKYADQNTQNIGADDYDPLFPYGYGLSYADVSAVPDKLTTDTGDVRYNMGQADVGSSCVD